MPVYQEARHAGTVGAPGRGPLPCRAPVASHGDQRPHDGIARRLWRP